MVDVVEAITCAKCGAPLKVSPGESVILCTYCGSENNLRADAKYIVSHSWMPNKLSKEDAIAKAREWMGGGLLMPPGMEKSEITKTDLVYIPLWAIEAKAKTQYAGLFQRGGEKRVEGNLDKSLFWKVLGRRDSKFPVREYKIPLSAKVPFTIEEAVRGEMLNGEIDEQEAKQVATTEIEDYMQMVASEQVDKFEIIETNVEFGATEFVHIPIWVIDFAFGGKSYSLMVEGTNGEVIWGEIPASDFVSNDMKLVMAAAAVLVLVAAVALLVLAFIH